MALPIINKDRHLSDMLKDLKILLQDLDGIESIFTTSALESHITASDISRTNKASLMYMVKMYKTYDNSYN